MHTVVILPVVLHLEGTQGGRQHKMLITHLIIMLC